MVIGKYNWRQSQMPTVSMFGGRKKGAKIVGCIRLGEWLYSNRQCLGQASSTFLFWTPWVDCRDRGEVTQWYFSSTSAQKRNRVGFAMHDATFSLAQCVMLAHMSVARIRISSKLTTRRHHGCFFSLKFPLQFRLLLSRSVNLSNSTLILNSTSKFVKFVHW